MVNIYPSHSASHLSSLGAEIEEVSLPSFAAGLPAYYIIALSEASSNLARYDGVRYGARCERAELREMIRASRASGLGQEVQRRVLMGTYALSAGYYDELYGKAEKVRTLVTRELRQALKSYDALISPVAPSTPFALGLAQRDPLEMYKGAMAVKLYASGLNGYQCSSTIPTCYLICLSVYQSNKNRRRYHDGQCQPGRRPRIVGALWSDR